MTQSSLQVFLIMFAFTVGCAKDKAPSLEAEPDTEEKKESLVHSPTKKADYISRGFPSPDRQWNPKDYTAASQALARMVSTERQSIPRYKGVGATLFSRMVSDENFAILKNKSLPLNQRMPLALDFLPAVKSLSLAYMNASTAKVFFGNELLELQTHQLAGAAAMMIPTDEFIATLSPTDANYQVRMDGLAQMKQGLGAMINGSLMSLSETKNYSDEQLIRFSAQLERLLPQLLTSLPHSIRTESKNHLAKIGSASSSSALKAAIAKIEMAIATR